MTKVIDFRKKKISKSSRKIKPIKVLDNLLDEKFKILFLIISIVGIFIGALAYNYLKNEQFSLNIYERFQVLNSENYKSVFLYLIRIDLIFILLNFFIGTSFLGSTLSFLAPILKSIYMGFLSGYLYNEYELKGVLFCILLLYPCFAITTTSLIFTSNENIYMSKYIFDCINGKITTDNISIKLYFIRYLLLFVVDIVCIGLTALFIIFLAPKINII